jgi:hypothetical protein
MRRALPLAALTLVLTAIAHPAAAAPASTAKCTATAKLQYIGVDGIRTFAVRPFSANVLDEPPRPFSDDFRSRREKNWDWTNYGDSCLRTGPQGLAASVPKDAASYTYNNAELVSRTAYPAGTPGPGQGVTTMTVRVAGASLSGINGTRGWGFWNTSLVQPLSGVAFFIYLGGPAGSTKMAGRELPRGLYAFVQKAGVPTVVQRLDQSALARNTTYAVQLRPDEVVFRINGKRVFRTRVVPSVRMPARIWVDSAGYHDVAVPGMPVLFVPRFLKMPRESTARVVWANVTYQR